MEFRTGTFSGVVTMALAWALIWALPGGAIEAVDNVAPAAHGFTRLVDMWPQTLGLPGIVGGVLFSLLLMVTEGRRRFAEVAPARAVGWGSLAGLLAGVLVVWILDPGLSDPWQLAVTLAGVATLLGAVAGFASPLLFRYAAERRAPAAS